MLQDYYQILLCKKHAIKKSHFLHDLEESKSQSLGERLHKKIRQYVYI